jgi:acyl carrier protein
MALDSPIATRIRTALAEHLKRDVSKVQLQDDLKKDLGLDSLAMIELLFKIEEAFDLEIPNDDLSQITTVGDVIAYVERRLGSGAGAPAARPVATATTTHHPDIGARAAAKPAASKKKGSRGG